MTNTDEPSREVKLYLKNQFKTDVKKDIKRELKKQLKDEVVTELRRKLTEEFMARFKEGLKKELITELKQEWANIIAGHFVPEDFRFNATRTDEDMNGTDGSPIDDKSDTSSDANDMNGVPVDDEMFASHGTLGYVTEMDRMAWRTMYPHLKSSSYIWTAYDTYPADFDVTKDLVCKKIIRASQQVWRNYDFPATKRFLQQVSAEAKLAKSKVVSTPTFQKWHRTAAGNLK